MIEQQPENNAKEKFNIQNAVVLLILNLINSILAAYHCSDIFLTAHQYQNDAGIKTVLYAGMTVVALNAGFGILFLCLSISKFIENPSFRGCYLEFCP